jgi:hypothetical protein
MWYPFSLSALSFQVKCIWLEDTAIGVSSLGSTGVVCEGVSVIDKKSLFRINEILSCQTGFFNIIFRAWVQRGGGISCAEANLPFRSVLLIFQTVKRHITPASHCDNYTAMAFSG